MREQGATDPPGAVTGPLLSDDGAAQPGTAALIEASVLEQACSVHTANRYAGPDGRAPGSVSR
ncbi:hypothetical protein VR46_17540 [Streptomyces sp. NRRL S-444]|nr:hypothetical protein VR46_17540 [Streptomyces sp. NRRL S-444]